MQCWEERSKTRRRGARHSRGGRGVARRNEEGRCGEGGGCGLAGRASAGRRSEGRGVGRRGAAGLGVVVDPVTPVPVNTRAEAWFTHIGNLGNAGTAFRCRDGYIGPVNAGQGPVASGSANAFSARGGYDGE